MILVCGQKLNDKNAIILSMLETEEIDIKKVDLTQSGYDGQIGILAAVEIYGEKGKVAVSLGG